MSLLKTSEIPEIFFLPLVSVLSSSSTSSSTSSIASKASLAFSVEGITSSFSVPSSCSSTSSSTSVPSSSVSTLDATSVASFVIVSMSIFASLSKNPGFVSSGKIAVSAVGAGLNTSSRFGFKLLTCIIY